MKQPNTTARKKNIERILVSSWFSGALMGIALAIAGLSIFMWQYWLIIVVSLYGLICWDYRNENYE